MDPLHDPVIGLVETKTSETSKLRSIATELYSRKLAPLIRELKHARGMSVLVGVHTLTLIERSGIFEGMRDDLIHRLKVQEDDLAKHLLCATVSPGNRECIEYLKQFIEDWSDPLPQR